MAPEVDKWRVEREVAIHSSVRYDALPVPLRLSGYVRLFDYFVSHSQLVYRGTDEERESPFFEDVWFHAVHYLDGPIHCEHPVIRQADSGETDYISRRCGETRGTLRDYVIRDAEDRTIYIRAGFFLVARHSLPGHVSLISRW